MGFNLGKKRSLDLAAILPVVLGVFSLLGILIVLMLGRFYASRASTPLPDTATPFNYLLIGTEPGFSASTPELAVAGNGTDPIVVLNPGARSATPLFVIIEHSHTPSWTPGPTITPTPSRTRVMPTFTEETLEPGTSTRTPVPSHTPTPSRTPTPPRTFTGTPAGSTPAALGSGTYDDSHPSLAYSGWASVTDASAYQSTLHVSNTTGSTITFQFTGQQLRFTFQNGVSFGTIRIRIGVLNFDLDETETNEYVSPVLAQGTYPVVITHLSGGSVNIDSVIIPE